MTSLLSVQKSPHSFLLSTIFQYYQGLFVAKMYGLSEIAKIFHLEWDAGYENGWALDKQDLLNVPSGLSMLSVFLGSFVLTSTDI